MRTRLARIAAAAKPIAPELALASAVLAGWALLTGGIASIGRPRVVWLVSSGLLCLTLAGWGLLRDLAREGLYVVLATQQERRESRRNTRPRRVA